jgi:protein-L-isoaspartate O-methyltransferase
MTVKSTQGYTGSIQCFIEATEAIEFEELHEFFSDLIPVSTSRILDIGSGSGRDTASLAKMGHSVVAVEP